MSVKRLFNFANILDSSNHRDTRLDLFRSVAVLLVVFFHFNIHTSIIPGWNQLIREGGALGVSMFFMLSGYLIANPFIESLNNNTSYSYQKHFIKRLLRILPLYWISCIIFYLLRNYIHTYYQGSYSFSIHDLLLNMLFLKDDFRVLNPVIWTLKIEVLFYLFFPVFFYFIKGKIRNSTRYPFISAVVLSLIFFTYRLALYTPNNNFEEQFFNNLDTLLFGVLISALMRIKVKYFMYPTVVLWGSLFFIISLSILHQDFLLTIHWVYPYYKTITTFLIFISLLSILQLNKKNINEFRFFPMPFFTFIAVISYSIYLFHFNIYYDLALPIVFGPSESISGIALSFARLIALFFTIIIAYFTYLIIERPVSKFVPVIIRKLVKPS